MLLGIVATCRALGVPVQAYLAWAFERLGTHRDVFALPIHELTPAAFKKTPPEGSPPFGAPSITASLIGHAPPTSALSSP